jgi:cyclopropane fatty-acyl-phospholipid synthase-like methyltransferase
VDEADLLHAGGPARRWGNLGWWPVDAPARALAAWSYAEACAALADRVGRAAGLRPGDRVLSLACGRGEELATWVERFGVAEVVGLEPDPAAAREAHALVQARGHGARVRVLAATLGGWPGRARAAPPPPAGLGLFDRVVCVDAAYHLGPRQDFLQRATARLRPGGRLAYTDLVRAPAPPTDAERSTPWTVRALQAWAARHGLDLGQVGTVEATAEHLRRLGAEDLAVERLDEAVLDGFAAYARRQSRALGWRRLTPAWWRVTGTAWGLAPLRRAGLGYALFSARSPGAPAVDEPAPTPDAADRDAAGLEGPEGPEGPKAPTGATGDAPEPRGAAMRSIASTTRRADRTALSSSGTPDCA